MGVLKYIFLLHTANPAAGDRPKFCQVLPVGCFRPAKILSSAIRFSLFGSWDRFGVTLGSF